MPILWAVVSIESMPTVSKVFTAGTFNEDASARRMLTGPRNLWS